MRVVLTLRAEQQLDDLYNTVANAAGTRRADALIGRIIAQCQSLTTCPNRGAPRADILPGLRTIAFERHTLIAYFLAEAELVIEGVFHGGQDVPTRLGAHP